MSQFGSKVVAVIDTQSAFGVTIKTLKENVDTLTGQMSTLLADAPETLDTLNEIAAAISDDPAFFTTMATANTALQNNIDALTTAAANARTALQTALQTNIDGVATDLTTESTARGTAIANLDNIIAALQTDVDTNEADADAAIGLKFDKAGGTLTGSLAIAKSFPDVELKAGNEKRILFSDAGGGSTAAIKHVSTTLDFYAGGIAAGNKEMSIGTDGVDVSALKIDGTAVTATAAEINAFDGRLDTLEADPTTAAAVATVQADVDANEAASDAAEAALSGRLDTLEADPTTKTYVDTQVSGLVDAAPGALDTLNELAAALGDDANFAATVTASIAAVQSDVNQNETDADAAIAAVQADVDQNESDADAAIAAVQADVDQNEADADTAIALKANKAGDTFTGDILLRSPTGNAVALKLSRADHPDMSCEWKISPSYVNSDKECLSVLAAGQPVAHFDERQRVSINKTDPDYTLDVAGDGKFSTGLTVGGLTDAANDAAAATAGVAVNQLYRNGSVVMIRVS